VPNDVAEPTYDALPTKSRTRDRVDGRAGPSTNVDEGIKQDDAGDEDDPDQDYIRKVFEDELKAADAEEKPDPLKRKKILLASIGHLDSFKVPEHLRYPEFDDKGKPNKKFGQISDPVRALYMICEAKGILHSFHQASRTFSRRIVKPSHSIPYYRLMEFGWQPSVAHTDFAGILNANALYSFTVGFPQMIFSISFVFYAATVEADTIVCKTNPCSIYEDFFKPNVQSSLVAGSLAVGLISLFISVLNIVVDFPAQLFDIAEKEETAMMFSLQAEEATRTWEDKLAIEVAENVKTLLKLSTRDPENLNQGMEAPSLCIGQVMIIERAAMEKKVQYIEHFLGMAEDEKERREALRKGKRPKPQVAPVEEEEEEEEEEEYDEEYDDVEAAPPPKQVAFAQPAAPKPDSPKSAPIPAVAAVEAIPEEPAPPAKEPSAGTLAAAGAVSSSTGDGDPDERV